MFKGSCLCGSVRWAADGPTGEMSHCHCSICRKMHGAPFGTYVSVAASDYELLEGADAIRTYETTPGFVRAFCSKCGSLAPMPVGNGRVAIPCGGIDGDPGVRPTMHIFAASKAPWVNIEDGLARHAAYPAGGPAEIPQPSRAGGKPGVLHGSCQCGGVAFEVEEPFTAIHNCHCSRCRKARAAAHTTNGFVPIERFRFLRGADLIEQYKLPEAASFTQAFCRVCGSAAPRLRADVAVVPLAALDDAPSRGSDDHIYTGSKAPWHEIADDLPQFEEGPG